MTTRELTAALKNPNTTCSELSGLREENEFTHEQNLLFVKHPNVEPLALYFIWMYNGNPELAAIIAGRSEKHEDYLLEQIARDVKRNPHNWEREEWEAVMSAFRRVLRKKSHSKYRHLYKITYDDGPNHAWDDDFWDDDSFYY